MKLALRIVATAIVAAGAVATAYVGAPVLASASSSAPVGAVALGNVAAARAARAPTPAPDASSRDTIFLDATALEAIAADGDTPEAAAETGNSDTGDAAPQVAFVPLDGDTDRATWIRPTWFPPVTDVEAVGFMDGPARGGRGPSLRSRAAFVYDLDAGEVLVDKNADVVRPVASLTKLVSSLALMSADPDLDTELCIGAAQYPTRSGARSRLSTGDCVGGWDVLGAALVSSDNRAAYALAAVARLHMDDFIARMNTVSADLGMDRSSWSDPSGLEDENLSTARDIARATVAVAAHPVLAPVATAPYWDLHRSNKAAPRRLFTTDRLAGRQDLTVLAAKTGYTDTARYCFSTVLQTRDGRRLVISLLGGEGKLTRWADVERILRWVETSESKTG